MSTAPPKKNINLISGPPPIPTSLRICPVTFLTGRFCAREESSVVHMVHSVVHLTNKLKKDIIATNSHVEVLGHECKLLDVKKKFSFPPPPSLVNLFFNFCSPACMERVQIGCKN